MVLFILLVPITLIAFIGLLIYNWKHLGKAVFQGAIDNAINVTPQIKALDQKIAQNQADILSLRTQNVKLNQQKKQVAKDVARETTVKLRAVTDAKSVMNL